MNRKNLYITIFLLFLLLKPSLAFGEIRIAVFSDSHGSTTTYADVIDTVLKYKPDVAIHCGDIVDSNASEWDNFNEVTSPLREISEFFPAPGNHDYGVGIELYKANFYLPGNELWYSIDRENVHIIILDSNSSLPESSPQYIWLEKDLQSMPESALFTICAFHHPILSSVKTADSIFMENAMRLFEDYGVDVVFSGHAHNYERSFYDGIYYIVTSGAGGALRDKWVTNEYSQVYIKEHHFCLVTVNESEMKVQAIDTSMHVLDQFSITSDEYSSILYGDVSGNNRITGYDASIAARYAARIVAFNEDQIIRADVNGDGVVSASDAALIARYSVSIISSFPVENQ